MLADVDCCECNPLPVHPHEVNALTSVVIVCGCWHPATSAPLPASCTVIGWWDEVEDQRLVVPSAPLVFDCPPDPSQRRSLAAENPRHRSRARWPTLRGIRRRNSGQKSPSPGPRHLNRSGDCRAYRIDRQRVGRQVLGQVSVGVQPLPVEQPVHRR